MCCACGSVDRKGAEKKNMQLAAVEDFETEPTLERMQPANHVAVANHVMWQ